MSGSFQSARDWKPSPPPVTSQSLVRMPTRFRVPRGNALRAVVLGAAIDMVERQGVVDGDAVELGDGDVVEVTPGFAVVIGLVEAAVVADEEVIRVSGVEVREWLSEWTWPSRGRRVFRRPR